MSFELDQTNELIRAIFADREMDSYVRMIANMADICGLIDRETKEPVTQLDARKMIVHDMQVQGIGTIRELLDGHPSGIDRRFDDDFKYVRYLLGEYASLGEKE